MLPPATKRGGFLSYYLMLPMINIPGSAAVANILRYSYLKGIIIKSIYYYHSYSLPCIRLGTVKRSSRQLSFNSDSIYRKHCCTDIALRTEPLQLLRGEVRVRWCQKIRIAVQGTEFISRLTRSILHNMEIYHTHDAKILMASILMIWFHVRLS